MYDADNLKNKRSQAAAKSKKIVPTVDHKAGATTNGTMKGKEHVGEYR
jgi:hypothetical protein